MKTGENYTWTTVDYVSSPFAFIIGSLNALPEKSNGPWCSGNTTSFRTNLLEGFDYIDNSKPLDAALAYYKGFKYLDEVGVLCLSAFSSTLDSNHWLS